MKIILTSNTSWNLFNFRKDLIKKMISMGHKVYVVAPFDKYTIKLKELGIIYHEIKLSRFHKTILSDFLYIFKIFFKIYHIKPDVVHNFTLKPVIYVGIVANLFKNIKVINSITGLGLSFTNSKSFLNKFILFLIKISFNKRYKFIFQNPDDINFFKKRKILNSKQCYLIRGSGVEIQNYNKGVSKLNDVVVFGIMSRMLWSKGIKDFVDASKILINKNLKIKFIILGSPDNNSPDSIPISWLEEINKIDKISWIPHKDNVYNFLKKIDVFVLPTYYPEGLPKSLLEAASMKLPLIATNTPGCKEIVKNNINGFLIDIQNSNQLADKMYTLFSNQKLRREMGNKSFEIVSKEFSIDLVIKKTLKVYNSI